MRRRELLAALPGAALLVSRPARARPRPIAEFVTRLAEKLAGHPYAPPSTAVPPELAALDYDQYRDLRYRPEKAVWRELGLPFQLQMFHRGGLQRTAVELYEVAQGAIRPITYSPDLFTSGRLAPALLHPDLGFAGFRIHAPINDPARFDEFAVFLGASYFRAAPQGGVYGLSARGLEIGSGRAGEEFPIFRAFYIERPQPTDRSITVHALLDGPSVTGAYEFLITPGEPTTFDVDLVLFPRVPLDRVGLAPLTSMYLFGAEQPRRFDDFRPEVHDSDGLLVEASYSEPLWRPLSNPTQVQISRFAGSQPRGFGLLQRARSLETYYDLEASYHRRPSAWVEPLGAWGDGAVQLVELPAASEADDNIVAAWRPAQPLEPGRPARFRYRLNWSSTAAPGEAVAQARVWRVGQGESRDRRRFILEFAPAGPGLDGLDADVSATRGAILNLSMQANPGVGGVRVSFEFDPQGAEASELQARLVQGGTPISERWVRPWRA